MWLQKQKKFWKTICRKNNKKWIPLSLLIIVVAVGSFFYINRAGKKTEKSSGETKEIWKPFKVSKKEEEICEKAADNIAKAYGKKYTGDAARNMSTKVQEEIIGRIGSLGYSAVDVKNRIPMEHASNVEDFYKKGKENQQASVSIVRLKTDGGFSLIKLSVKNGKTTALLTTAQWNRKGTIDITEIVKYKVKKLQMTEKGYLFCEFYLSDQAELQSDGMIGIRVKPLMKENAAFCEKYLDPVGYLGKESFRSSWKNKKMKAMKEKEGYGIYKPGGIPYPEIMDYKKNGQILTLTVDAVWIEKGTDCAFTHVVKIKEKPDGSFSYVSNRVLP